MTIRLTRCSGLRAARALLALFCAMGCLAASSLAVAQTSGTWTSAAGGTWNNTANWSGGAVASGTGASANFASLDITGTQTVTLNTAYTLGSLAFGDTATSSTGSWLISNGGTIGNTLTLNAGSGTTPVITVSGMGGGRATIDARISGTQGLSVNTAGDGSAGLLVLSGTNNYTGNTAINSGTVHFSTLGSWQSLTGTFTVSNAALLVSTTTAGGNTWSRPIVASGTGIVLGQTGGGGRIDFNTVISGTGGVALAPGTMGLGGLNTYSGPTTVGAGVTLLLSSTGATGSPGLPISGAFGTGTVALAGGSLRTFSNTQNVLINNVVNVTADTAFAQSGNPASSIIFTGPTTLVGGTRTLTTTDGGGNTIEFNGAIGDGGNGYGLVKAGSRTLVLGGSNTYSGATSLNSGTLRLGHQFALQNSTFSHSGTGTLLFSSAVSGNAFTFGGLSASSTAATLSLSNTAAAAITLTVGGNNASTSYAGSLTGGGSLVKTGSGMLALSGSNSYAGTTTVSAGILSMASTSSLPGYDTGGRYSVAAGAGLAVGNAVDDAAVASILASGNIGSGAAFGFDTSLGDRTYSAALSGAIGLVKAGGNTLTLTGSNGFAGATTLSGGTLALGDANALAGGGDVTFSGGALRYSASNQADLAGRIVGSGSAIVVDTNSQSVAWAGDLAASNAAGLTKLGVGTLTLSGSNAYAGTTTLARGVLALGSGNALPSTGNVTFSGGTLQYSADNTIDYTARIVNSGSAVSIDTNGQGVTFTGGVDSTNTAGLVKLGSGTLSLAGASTYSGTTTLAGGVLALGNAAALPAAGSITFTGGSLQYSASNQADLAARIFGSTAAIRIDTAGQDVTFAGNLASGNSGGLTKQGLGTLMLSGSNTFSGPITVSAGTLALNADKAVPSSSTSIVLDGGTLLRSSTLSPSLSNSISLGAGGGEIRNGTGNQWTVSGAIADGTGSGMLVLTPAGGELVFGNASSTYTGGTRIPTAASAIAVSADAAFGSGTITFEGGSIRTTGAGARTFANAIAFSGDATFTTSQKDLTFNGPGTILGASRTITVSATTALATYNGSIGDGGAGLGFTKAGVGTLILGGSNTYSGTTTLSAGTLRLANADALAGGGNLSSTGGTLQYTESNTRDYASRFRSSTSSIRIDTNGQTVTWNGAVDATNVGGLTKSGSGTLVLAGANTYTGTTTVSGGALQIGDGGISGSIAGNVALSSTATLVFNRSDSFTHSGAISGTGTLTKSGPGTLTLSGTSTLGNGSTIAINGGALVLSGFTTLNTSGVSFVYTIDSGTLAMATTAATSGFRFGSVAIGPGGATIRSDVRADNATVISGTSTTASLTYGTMSGTVSNVIMVIGGTNTYAGGTTLESGVSLYVDNNSAFGTGILHLAGGAIQSRSGPPRILANAVTISANTQFNAAAGNPNLTFTGATTLSGGTRTLQVDNVLTSGSSAGQPGVIFSNAIGDGGNGFGITKTGSGVLALGGANTYTGLTTLAAGTIQLQNQAALANSTLALSGTGGVVFDAVVVGNGFTLGGLSAASATASLSLQNSAANAIALTVGGNNASTTYAGLLAGSGSLVKTGSGTLTLGGANSYAGTTTVSAGTLLVNGNQSAATGAMLIDALATLGGSGTIGGAVTVNGILSPGTSPGELTLASLVLGGTSTTLMEINGTVRGTLYDGVTLTDGSGPTYGGVLSLAFGNGSAFGDNTTFDLFQFTGSPSGSFSSVTSSGFYAGTWTNNNDGTFRLEQGGQTLTFSQSSGDIVVVPEPAALALAGIGAGVAGWRLIRRRRRPV